MTFTANHAKKLLRSSSRTAYQWDRNTTASPDARIDLDRAVRRLPERQRHAIELYYFVGLRVDEVAVVMGCAEGTVKSTLSAARNNLRTILGEDYGE